MDANPAVPCSCRCSTSYMNAALVAVDRLRARTAGRGRRAVPQNPPASSEQVRTPGHQSIVRASAHTASTLPRTLTPGRSRYRRQRVRRAAVEFYSISGIACAPPRLRLAGQAIATTSVTRRRRRPADRPYLPRFGTPPATPASSAMPTSRSWRRGPGLSIGRCCGRDPSCVTCAARRRQCSFASPERGCSLVDGADDARAIDALAAAATSTDPASPTSRGFSAGWLTSLND